MVYILIMLGTVSVSLHQNTILTNINKGIAYISFLLCKQNNNLSLEFSFQFFNNTICVYF